MSCDKMAEIQEAIPLIVKEQLHVQMNRPSAPQLPLYHYQFPPQALQMTRPQSHTAPTTVPRFPDSVSRLLLLIGRSISPAASKESKWKLPYIQSTIIDNDSQPPVLALGLTETWLTESVSEAQSELKGFQCIRSDRDSILPLSY